MPVIKDFTGGDPITARFLFGEFFEFIPQGKLWLTGNSKPIINETTYAAWRRPRLIPFTVQIPKEKRIARLAEELIEEELPGIFNWALEGLWEWHKIGSSPPAIVAEATEEYRKESDSIGAFIDARCQLAPAGAAIIRTFAKNIRGSAPTADLILNARMSFLYISKERKASVGRKACTG
jgi:phage/plasmid primase, P4 family, C-terminal domain